MNLNCLTFSYVEIQWKKLLKTIGCGPIRRGRPQEDILKMQWNRSTAIGLANASCTCCHGEGMRVVHKTREAPCNCVFRSIFRACYNRFRECVALGDQTKAVSLEQGGARRSARPTSSPPRAGFIS